MGIPTATVQAQTVALLAKKSALTAIETGLCHSYRALIHTVSRHDKAAVSSVVAESR